MGDGVGQASQDRCAVVLGHGGAAEQDVARPDHAVRVPVSIEVHRGHDGRLVSRARGLQRDPGHANVVDGVAHDPELDRGDVGARHHEATAQGIVPWAFGGGEVQRDQGERRLHVELAVAPRRVGHPAAEPGVRNAGEAVLTRAPGEDRAHLLRRQVRLALEQQRHRARHHRRRHRRPAEQHMHPVGGDERARRGWAGGARVDREDPLSRSGQVRLLAGREAVAHRARGTGRRKRGEVADLLAHDVLKVPGLRGPVHPVHVSGDGDRPGGVPRGVDDVGVVAAARDLGAREGAGCGVFPDVETSGAAETIEPDRDHPRPRGGGMGGVLIIHLDVGQAIAVLRLWAAGRVVDVDVALGPLVLRGGVGRAAGERGAVGAPHRDCDGIASVVPQAE